MSITDPDREDTFPASIGPNTHRKASMISESKDRTVAIEITDGKVTNVDIDRVTYGLIKPDRLAEAVAQAVQGVLDEIGRPRMDVDAVRARLDEVTQHVNQQLGAIYSDREQIMSQMQERVDDSIAQWRRVKQASDHVR